MFVMFVMFVIFVMFVMFVKFVGIKPMSSHFQIKHSTTEIHPPIGVPRWSSSDGKVGQVD